MLRESGHLSLRLAHVHLAHGAGEAQGAQAFVGGRRVGGQVHHHQRLAVSAEAVLQQERQLGVPEWDLHRAGARGHCEGGHTRAAGGGDHAHA